MYRWWPLAIFYTWIERFGSSETGVKCSLVAWRTTSSFFIEMQMGFNWPLHWDLYGEVPISTGRLHTLIQRNLNVVYSVPVGRPKPNQVILWGIMSAREADGEVGNFANISFIRGGYCATDWKLVHSDHQLVHWKRGRMETPGGGYAPATQWIEAIRTLLRGYHSIPLRNFQKWLKI